MMKLDYGLMGVTGCLICKVVYFQSPVTCSFVDSLA